MAKKKKGWNQEFYFLGGQNIRRNIFILSREKIYGKAIQALGALHVLNSNEYMQSRGLDLEERSRVARLKAKFMIVKNLI